MNRWLIKKRVQVENEEPMNEVSQTANEEEGDSKNESERGTPEPGPEGAPGQSIAAISSTSPVSCTADTDTSPSDLSQSPANEPRRPLLRRYPATKVGQQDRYFNRRWYEDYKWLEYSISKDRVFCFACRHFQRPGNHGEKAAFTHNGYQNWKKATSSFKTHNVSVEHKYAMAVWNEWTIQKESGSTICNALSDGHAKIVNENREYMRAVVESLRFTAYQGLSQRGDTENDTAVNQGNFLELLQMIGKFDKTVAQKISDNPRNAKYTHHDIQNEILDIMANMIRDQISSEVQDAEMFALMVDESKDLSKTEQVSVVLRYVKNDKAVEEFLHFTPADGLDAESLFATIKDTLSKCYIDHTACIAQCYDGAAVMSGVHNGVQEKFREEVPQAIYIHCHAHRLNLVLVDHVHFVKKQRELEPSQQPIELKKLSDTRWSCQYHSLWAVQKTLPAIIASLNDIKAQPNPRRSTDARSLLALIDAEFILHLVLFEDLFRTAKFMSDTLQSPELLLETATDLAHSVVTGLKEKRTEDSWRAIWSKAEALCTKVGVAKPPQLPQQKRQSQQPHHLQDYVVEAPVQTEHPCMSSLDKLRTSSFYPVIDRLVNEMTRRFSTEAGAVLMGTSALNPENATFLEKESLEPMAQLYGIKKDDLLAEVHQMRRLLERKKEQGETLSSTLEFLSMLKPYKDSFEDIYKLLRIAVTLPVTSASCERSFSCMRRVKTYLRNRMANPRLSNLACLSIHAERTKALDVQKIIDSFALNHSNRRIVLL